MAEQRLRVLEGQRELASFPVSTSKFGLGSEEGSHKTPLGEFEVGEKIGAGAALGTVFKGREPVGLYDPAEPVEEDLVLTRILWLNGLEEQNANTRDRYIYIHGTNQEGRLGRPASIGCIRMANRDVIQLFDLLEPGAPVSVIA